MERDTSKNLWHHSPLGGRRCFDHLIHVHVIQKITVNTSSTRLNRPQTLHSHGQIGPWLSTNLRPRGHSSGLGFFRFFYFYSNKNWFILKSCAGECREKLRWRMPRENSNDNNSLSTCVHDRIKNGQTQETWNLWSLRKLKFTGRYRTRHLLYKVRFAYSSFRN